MPFAAPTRSSSRSPGDGPVVNPPAVWFVEEGASLYLVPVTGSDSDWYRNIVNTPAIRVSAGDAELSTTAIPIADQARVDQVVDRFQEVRRRSGDRLLPEARRRGGGPAHLFLATTLEVERSEEASMATETIQAADHELLIGGERVETGEWSEVHSPYDGTVVGRVAKADAEVLDRAVSAAADAFAAGGFPQHERAAVLERAAALVSDREDELTIAIAAEAGKPVKTASRLSGARARSPSRRSWRARSPARRFRWRVRRAAPASSES